MIKSFYLLPVMALLLTGATQAENWVSLDRSGTSPTPAAKPATTPPVQLAASPSQLTPVQPSPKQPSAGALQVLYEEIEILKQEVQTLRGIVEEQTHELNKLKSEQKERYIELDRRMSQVLKGGASVAPVPGNTEPATADEKGAYESAFRLVNEKKFPQALSALRNFVAQFPKSELAVNAYYWTGQIHYIQGELDDARKAFLVVINQFPEHQKTADSKLKLGKVYHQLGEEAKAKEILKAVVADYAKSSPGTARLAENYLNQHF